MHILVASLDLVPLTTKLVGFLSYPLYRSGTRLEHAQAEFSQWHPDLPRFYTICVDLRVHAKMKMADKYDVLLPRHVTV